jgi:hypothetical protein
MVLGNIGRKSITPSELENEPVKFCLNPERKYFLGLTAKNVKRMVFPVAVGNNIRHSLSEGVECAGKKWLDNFLKRHPQLSLHKNQAITFARIKVSQKNFATFFDLFESERERKK